VKQVEPRALSCVDGAVLEAEYAAATGAARAAAVLCHPHPQYGGTMRSIVISALFDALPERGISCLRFNFRGVERSTGTHGGGVDEVADVLAALDAIAADAPGLVHPLVGWSFGADVSLAVTDSRIAGWVAIAPPLRFRQAHPSGSSFGPVAADPRRKHLVLAANDEFRAPAEIEEEVAGWTRTTTEIVAGASHFFVGRTDRVVTAVDEFVGEIS
jgi:alpha/beta superfamily hydrolase